jgi:hypothetical protein
MLVVRRHYCPYSYDRKRGCRRRRQIPRPSPTRCYRSKARRSKSRTLPRTHRLCESCTGAGTHPASQRGSCRALRRSWRDDRQMPGTPSLSSRSVLLPCWKTDRPQSPHQHNDKIHRNRNRNHCRYRNRYRNRCLNRCLNRRRYRRRCHRQEVSCRRSHKPKKPLRDTARPQHPKT